MENFCVGILLCCWCSCVLMCLCNLENPGNLVVLNTCWISFNLTHLPLDDEFSYIKLESTAILAAL